MSRIHEALKKAEQERAMSQPPRMENMSTAAAEPLSDAEAVIAGASALAGMSAGSFLAVR